jgi:hypothetical protein
VTSWTRELGYGSCRKEGPWGEWAHLRMQEPREVPGTGRRCIPPEVAIFTIPVWVMGTGGEGFFPSCVWVWGSLTRWVRRMDLTGPTTSVGTRTDYSVGPWDYTACATRHLTAWSTRTTEEKYSVRKLCMSRAVWKTPIRTRLVLSPYSDL